MPILSAVASLAKLLDPVIQILMMAAAVIQDIFGLVGSLFTGSFNSAIVEQGRAIEKSMEKNYGFSAGLYEMADGGIVTGPTRALIGEAGAEAVIPLTGNTEIKTDNSDVVAAIRNMSDKLNQGTLYEIA